jgi:hypothetical protein
MAAKRRRQVNTNEFRYCYVDESVHDNLGFVTMAFVFGGEGLDAAVADALKTSGLDPATEEFKSGAYMAHNPRMQAARDALFEVIRKEAEVAVVFAPRHHTVLLGKQCLQALQSVLIRNGIPPNHLTIHVDEGIFASEAEAKRLIGIFRFLASATFRASESSQRCRGIQLADLMAHTFAQIVCEAITGQLKLVDVGAPDTGYEKGFQMPLSVFLLVGIRHSIMARGMVYEGEIFDPATDPVVLGPDDDPVEYGQNPEVFGWGVQVAPEAHDTLRQAVRQMLDRIWLGCMH